MLGHHQSQHIPLAHHVNPMKPQWSVAIPMNSPCYLLAGSIPTPLKQTVSVGIVKYPILSGNLLRSYWKWPYLIYRTIIADSIAWWLSIGFGRRLLGIGPNHPVLVAESPWNIMKSLKSNRPIRRPIRLFMIQLLPDGFCGRSHGELENPPGRPLESSKNDGLASKR